MLLIVLFIVKNIYFSCRIINFVSVLGQIKPSPFQPCSAHIKCDSSAIRSVKYPQQSDILIYNDMGKSQNTNQLENKVLTTSYEFHWEHGDWGPCSVSCLGGESYFLFDALMIQFRHQNPNNFRATEGPCYLHCRISEKNCPKFLLRRGWKASK